MATNAAQTVGRTLARLAMLSGRSSPPASDSAASQSRTQILSLIQQADGPVSVDLLCESTGLHANTVRGHLDVLMAGGLVHREAGESHGRGRPPWLYRAGPADTDVYRELASSLAQQLGDSTDPLLIEDAAHRWGEVVEHGEPATTPDEAVEQAAEALRRLGFTATVGAIGDTIALGTCPYASLVAEQPIICDIHTALLGALLARSGQDVSVAEMDVWARPGLCLATLTRPDLRPARSIRPEPPADDPTAPGSPAPKMPVARKGSR